MKDAESNLRRDSVQKLFEGYSFNKKENSKTPGPNPNASYKLTNAATTNGNEDQPKDILLLSSSKKTE